MNTSFSRSRDRKRLIVAGALCAALFLSGCSAAGQATTGAKPSQAASAEPSLSFTGPNGEVPGTLDELALSDSDKSKVAAGKFTAAFVWHTTSEFVTAVERGARAEFERLGIKVVASTQANFDAATQANNLETVLALHPDIIVTTAVDPTSAAAAFQPALDKGTKLVIMTTPPKGYKAGKDFVSIVTVSLTQAGKFNAELLGKALGGKGEIGYMYHDADFWFTNQRDKAFKDWTAFEYPDEKIVAEEGFTDEAATQAIAAAMIARNPNIKGIYVAWATAAQGVLAALRDAGRTDIKVVTNDLDATLAADMMRDGNIVGLVGNGSVALGKGLATAAAYGALNKTAPPLIAVTPSTITKSTLDAGWKEDYGTKPPASVTG
ncbi:substrate-binding domain-containing protein [Cryobacterium mannosilyticum]|uniref:LacI family transcriptional regulator n=1 Tax=Cryobacterium mannosilyticum TaxID=1259190 RepID=A0A4R8WCJ9_9MICO|nr:substrate-binding domain-containing protein [Cryobacterium mannosilyticum]TFC05233.1 LacI family transcriptional regulator [Cryobacterium mannosilyticum]